jgi:hypothetical protein
MSSELLLNIAITSGVISIVMWVLGKLFMDHTDKWWDFPISASFLLSAPIAVIFFIAWVWST